MSKLQDLVRKTNCFPLNFRETVPDRHIYKELQADFEALEKELARLSIKDLETFFLWVDNPKEVGMCFSRIKQLLPKYDERKGFIECDRFVRRWRPGDLKMRLDARATFLRTREMELA